MYKIYLLNFIKIYQIFKKSHKLCQIQKLIKLQNFEKFKNNNLKRNF